MTQDITVVFKNVRFVHIVTETNPQRYCGQTEVKMSFVTDKVSWEEQISKLDKEGYDLMIVGAEK